MHACRRGVARRASAMHVRVVVCRLIFDLQRLNSAVHATNGRFFCLEGKKMKKEARFGSFGPIWQIFYLAARLPKNRLRTLAGSPASGPRTMGAWCSRPQPQDQIWPA